MNIRGFHEHCRVGKVTGSRKTILIPRIQLFPTDHTTSFIFCTRQYLIKIRFAMTINNFLGQMLKCVGTYQLSAALSHGQLYVAFSQAPSIGNVMGAITCKASTTYKK
jgi:hypothetical protein